MKKIIISVILMLILSISVFADDNSFARTEVKLPEISGQLSKLEDVTGWTKLPEGQWLEKKDRIPRYLSVSSTLQNYEIYSLGIDNFRLLELREFEYGGKDYYILYKHYTNGRYKYKNIEEGWSYWYYVDAFVFEKEELPAIQLIDKESQVFKIEVIAKSYEYYITKTYGNSYIREISQKIPAAFLEEDYGLPENLIINAMKLGGKVRFLLLEKNAYMYGLKGTLPVDKKEILENEVFRNFYYETDLNEFEDFWNLNN